MGKFIMLSEVNTILGFTATYDTSIQNWLPYMPGRVCAIANNYFTDDNNYVSCSDFLFSAAASTIRTAEDGYVNDGNFAVGDDIYIKGTMRNDGFFIISVVTTTLITIKTDSDYAIKTLIDEDVDVEDLASVLMRFVKFPRELKPIVANMIRYDIFERDSKKGITAEKVGNYSVSYSRAAGMGYNYPDDVIGGLDMFIYTAVG